MFVLHFLPRLYSIADSKESYYGNSDNGLKVGTVGTVLVLNEVESRVVSHVITIY